MSKKPIQPGDGDARHGTANGYRNLDCRCTRCRGAWADYIHWQHGQDRPPLSPDDPRHGSSTAYRYWHCRCDACHAGEAKRARDKRRVK